MKRLLPFIGVIYVLLATPAHAQTGHTWTCRITGVEQWQMLQPQQHYEQGLRPSWADCEAWRNGDPGTDYVWSYGPVETTTTTTTTTTTEPEPTTTTTMPEATTTTEPEPTTTTTEPEPEPTTTTTMAPTTTITSTSTTTTSTTTTTTTTTTTSTTTTTVPTTTTSTTTTSPPEPPQRLAKGSSNALAPGVTPEAQRAIVAASLGIIMNRKNR